MSRPSTSWGARLAAIPALGLVALAALGVPTATGATAAGSGALAPQRHSVIVTGPGAVAAVRDVGGRDLRSAGLGALAVAALTAGQSAALRARGLRVVLDAPATLDADSASAEPAAGGTQNTAELDQSAPPSDTPTTPIAADDDDATLDAAPPAAVPSPPARGDDGRKSQSSDKARASRGDRSNGDRNDRGGNNDRGTDNRPPAPQPEPRLSVRDIIAGSDWRGEGAGVTVAVIDSGVNEVPALAGRVVRGANFTSEGTSDQYGHGTFDAGLIAGDGTDANGARTRLVGVAPKARIVSVKVADASGRSTIGQVALGLAWVISHRAAYGIDVVNLSMSTATPMSYDVNPLNALAEAAWFSGITVIVSSGNGGRSTVSSAPANDPFVITVGSVYDKNTTTKHDDEVSPYTSLGRTIDGFMKPETMLPGQHVQSTLPAGTALARQQTVTGLPAGYGQLSGTSMATAVGSGFVALLLEASPGLTTDQVKGALTSRDHQHYEPSLTKAVHRAGHASANGGVRPSMALAAAYAQLFEHTTDYGSIDWNALDWRAVAWDQATWTDVDWTAATWSSATWAEATWGSATWASLTWATATWATASWTSASWANASWADASWSDASWADASWADASWVDAAADA
jgi:serine protease AprX